MRQRACRRPNCRTAAISGIPDQRTKWYRPSQVNTPAGSDRNLRHLHVRMESCERSRAAGQHAGPYEGSVAEGAVPRCRITPRRRHDDPAGRSGLEQWPEIIDVAIRWDGTRRRGLHRAMVDGIARFCEQQRLLDARGRYRLLAACDIVRGDCGISHSALSVWLVLGHTRQRSWLLRIQRGSRPVSFGRAVLTFMRRLLEGHRRTGGRLRAETLPQVITREGGQNVLTFQRNGPGRLD